MRRIERGGTALPDLGGIISGLPRPTEKEIRRKEPPRPEGYYCPGAEDVSDVLLIRGE